MSPVALHASSNLLYLIVDAAARSLVLACFLAVALRTFRVQAVRAKLAAWKGILLTTLAMPLFLLVTPSIAVIVPVPSFSTHTAPTSTRAVQSAPAPAIPLAPFDQNQFARSSSSNIASVSTAHAQSFDLARRVGDAMSWPVLAVFVYTLGALLLLGRMFIGMWFGNRLARAAAPIQDDETLRVLSNISQTAGLRVPPRLAASEVPCVPVTLGVRKPVILFPAAWRDWDQVELKAILAHEVSHVARHDALAQLLSLIHRAVFWFSPLSWWLDHHLASLAEQASDEAALSSGVDRTRYAESLLGFLAELEAVPARVWWQGVSMAKIGEGEKRVERILTWRSPMSKKLNKSLLSAFVVIFASAVALTVAARPSIVHAQEAAPPAPAPPLPPSQLAVPPVAIPEATGAQPVPPAALAVPGEPPQVAPPASVPALPNPPSAPVAAPAAPQAPASPSRLSVVGSVYASPSRLSVVGSAYWTWGPRFVIVTSGTDHFIMSGSEEDAEHARSLRSKIAGDFIWFERNGKSYVIRDPATVGQAKKIWSARDDAAKRQKELRNKEQELRKEMREQVQQKMHNVRIKIPDMSAQLQKLQSEIKDFSANGATLRQLSDLQREIGELQRALGEAGWNSRFEADINRQASEIGKQMSALGWQSGEIARKQAEHWREASKQMHQLLDDAITRGLAKPEK